MCLQLALLVLETVQGYHLPLNRCPQRSMAPLIQLREEQSLALKAEVKSLIEMGLWPLCSRARHT